MRRALAGLAPRAAADRRVLLATGLHGALVASLAAASVTGLAPALVIACALGWGANTVAHIHVHTPLFYGRAANRALSLYLSALLVFPQALWRYRHLCHHAGARADRVPPPRWREVALEAAVMTLALGGLVLLAPAFVLGAWLPGVAGGLALCSLQGRMEHARGEARGISCYGRVYNRLWFNDGFHAEHHRFPGVHWTELPARRLDAAASSRLPPWLRVLTSPWAPPTTKDGKEPMAPRRIARARVRPRGPVRPAPRAVGTDFGLTGTSCRFLSRPSELAPAALDRLERLVLGSAALQRRVVAAHVRATARVLPAPPESARVVGGGLFPRSVHVLRALAPAARLEVVDASPDHIARARAHLGAEGARAIAWRVARWSPAEDDGDVALVVLPLAYRAPDGGGRRALLVPGPSPRIVHTWLWTSARGHPSARVAWWLLKRVVYVPAAERA